MFSFDNITGSMNAFWISAPCFAIILLIILIKDWRRRKSASKLDRALFWMAFFTLLNCLPFSIEDLCASPIINDDRLMSFVTELSKATGAINFIFWINFSMQYMRINRPASSIVMALAGILGLFGFFIVGWDFFTAGSFKTLGTSSVVKTWLTTMMIYENIIFAMLTMYVSWCLIRRYRKRKKYDPRLFATLAAMLMPLTLSLFHWVDNPSHSIGLTTSCLVFYIFVISHEREGMQRSKEMFLENMSHEIRTSLNSVYGFAQLLCLPEGTWSEAERESYATHIRNSYNMLDMLLNDLMVSTRYDTHTYNVKQEPVDVQSVVAEAVDAMSVCMPSSVQISLTSELPKGFKIVSDGRRIRQIVQNLLTNTGQYILQGKIAVLLHKVADKIEITVIANMPAIQDKRYHAAVAKSKDDHKTGLSLRLHISRKLAMLLGGEVTRDYDYAGGIKYMVQLDIKEVGDTAHQAPAKVSNVIEED